MNISTISLTILVFVLIVLLSKKDKKISDYLLSIWLMLMGIHLVMFLQVEKVLPEIPFLYPLNEAIAYLHGPLLIFYVRSIIGSQSRKFPSFQIFHFLPALSVLLFFILIGTGKKDLENILNLGKPISLATYVIYAYSILRSYRSKLDDLVSYKERINLNWLYFLLICLLVLIIVGSIFLIFDLDKSLFNWHEGSTGKIILCILVILIGYWGIRQTPVIVRVHPTVPTVLQNPDLDKRKKDRPPKL